MRKRPPTRRIRTLPSHKVHTTVKHRTSNTVFASGRQSHPRPKRVVSPKKRHTNIHKVVHKTKTVKSEPWSFLPQAYASSTQSTPGWAGPQGVPSTKVTTGFGGTKKGISPTNRISDSWHMTQQGDLGAAIAASKKANPQQWKKVVRNQQLTQIGVGLSQINPDTGRPYNDPPTGQVGVISRWASDDPNRPQQVAQTSTAPPQTMGKVKKVKTGATTWYATNSQGQTIKGEGKLSMQARQFYGDKGYTLITSKPPGQFHQQRLSDTTGITTYTKWGDVSTTPRDLAGQKPNKIRTEQQKLSDKYGITTYNKDGTVSTAPKQQMQQSPGQPQNAAWWWQSPFSASAEKDKKEKPWGWW